MTATDLHTETVHVLLADPHRRATLEYLASRPSVSFEELRDYVSQSADTRTDKTRVAVGLVHHHLPRLEEAGVLEYDHNTKIVRGEPIPESLRTHLTDSDGELVVPSPQVAE